SALSAPTFALAAIEAGIQATFVIGDQLVVMLRWHARPDGPLCGRTVADIMAEYNFVVVEHRRGDEPGCLFPPQRTTIEPGDVLVVQGPLDALQQLSERGLKMT